MEKHILVACVALLGTNVALARFISADPLLGRQADPRTLNRYNYAHGDPVHGTDPSGRVTLSELGAAAAIGGMLSVAVQYEAGQGSDAIARNFVVGAAEGVVLGGVFSVGTKLLKLGRFSSFSSQLENVAILKRVGLSGKLFPGRAILSEQMTFKVGGETVLLQSNAIKATGAAKHLQELLGKAPSAGQSTLAETMVLQEAEAAIHLAIKDGLVNQAVSNAIQKAYVMKLDKLVVHTPGFTWEIAGEVVVQGGKRILKIFHMQPL